MRENFTFRSMDGTIVHGYRICPEPDVQLKGIVQIAHGMAETSERYERFGTSLAGQGYLVYVHDHRGHGKTAGELENVGYLADKDGFLWLVRDMHHLTIIIRKKYPSLPLFLMGHSMGSFAAQRYSMEYGNELSGLILSGSNGNQGIMLKAGYLIAAMEVRKNGRRAKSEKMDNLLFGGFNKIFSPNRTDFDWLTREEEEVDKYIKDPYCGTVFTGGFFYDFIKGLMAIEKKKNRRRVPKDLPMLIISGDKDPVGKCGKGVKNLYQIYKKTGVKDITLKLYKDGRHELLNELNKEEVTEEIIGWLKGHNKDNE
ncbi:alpha/beta hydrolase [Anaerocolumna xylanovorans]|uniref:Lysophospholipase, alpha-beta hydrolase superfamily n=1 Tax=Anaerocolumna xylanovorans DSM 12503 TaxID=1121345 RepID=A0A1M7YEB4_9FIRM|nr:alpha/beta hydrolase [Anaerocolumna xylanovorans]SHO50984.1 Lysophospholipase, alpha-beta hydrolase superfamily [Anaerocolumna xylanovorans DSM 12503]